MSTALAQLFSLAGKVALVNGGSRGIGEAIAKGLADQGAHVIVASRKLAACQAVVADIVACGGSSEARSMHAGDHEQIDDMFAHIEQTHQRLDIVINCAAASPYYGPVEDTPLSAFDKTFEVNVRGPFYISCKATKLMQRSGGGSIVNVSSVNGVTPGDLQGCYSMTKAALINMTKAFARENGQHNIRVNALLPGFVETNLTKYWVADEQMVEQMLQRYPLSRIGQPQDMVGAVLYLVSDAASFTTGSCITVDGGYTA